MLKIVVAVLAAVLLASCATAPSTRTYGVSQEVSREKAKPPAARKTEPAKQATTVKAKPKPKRDHWWGGWWLR